MKHAKVKDKWFTHDGKGWVDSDGKPATVVAEHHVKFFKTTEDAEKAGFGGKKP